MDAFLVDPGRDQDFALSGAGGGVSHRPRDWDDEALAALYRVHYGPLVRQAALLLGDVAAAEDAVQDSFIAMYGAWRRLRDDDKAVHYLRRTVINRSRSMLRHEAVARRHLQPMPPDLPSAEEQVLARQECMLVAAALEILSPRQLEALVLRYYADLSEAQIAAAMGVSKGAVKAHLWRAMASLRTRLAAEAMMSGRVAQQARTRKCAGR